MKSGDTGKIINISYTDRYYVRTWNITVQFVYGQEAVIDKCPMMTKVHTTLKVGKIYRVFTRRALMVDRFDYEVTFKYSIADAIHVLHYRKAIRE